VPSLSTILILVPRTSLFVQCLYEVGRHDKVQLLDIFYEAINPDLQNASDRDVVSNTNCETLSGVKGNGFIDQAMKTVRYDSSSRFQVWMHKASGLLSLLELRDVRKNW
jgi:origin recognition complex subunit 3